MTLAQDLTAPSTARQFTEAVCDAAGLVEDVRESAVLAVSEVVTNAVVHGLSAPRLTVWTSDTSVRIEVGDTGSALPIHTDAAEDATSGRGLAILESCSTAWGWRLKRQGKVVWFVVRSDGPGGRGADPCLSVDDRRHGVRRRVCLPAVGVERRRPERAREGGPPRPGSGIA